MDTPVPEQLSSHRGADLEDVFHGSYRRLVVQLYGVIGDRAEAEDVVQEAFVRAVAAGQRFTTTGNPEAWLRTTALNLHRSRWRKLRNFSRVKERLAAPRDVPGLEARLDVIEALRSLSPEQREVVALHHLADIPVSDIAQELPDLALIERRGRALRRRKVATAAGGLALALVAGIAITGIATDDVDAGPGPAAPPSPAPTTGWDAGVRTAVDQGEEVLLPGPSEVVYDGVTVRFDVPGEQWEWWSLATGLRRAVDAPDEYGAVVFFLRGPEVRLHPCRSVRTQELGTDPDQLLSNVAPLLDLANSRVLQEPRVVSAFGGTAVHLRLQTEGTCAEGGDLPLQLRGTFHDSAASMAWPGSYELDLWHVLLPGAVPASMLVGGWDLDGTSRHLAERRALLDSIRIDAD